MEQTIEPELADAWVNDVHARHQTPGSPIGRDAPRLSCVTHHCPATSMPHRFNDPAIRGIEPYWDVGGFASSFYKLPNLSQPIRP